LKLVDHFYLFGRGINLTAEVSQTRFDPGFAAVYPRSAFGCAQKSPHRSSCRAMECGGWAARGQPACILFAEQAVHRGIAQPGILQTVEFLPRGGKPDWSSTFSFTIR